MFGLRNHNLSYKEQVVSINLLFNLNLFQFVSFFLLINDIFFNLFPLIFYLMIFFSGRSSRDGPRGRGSSLGRGQKFGSSRDPEVSRGQLHLLGLQPRGRGHVERPERQSDV